MDTDVLREVPLDVSRIDGEIERLKQAADLLDGILGMFDEGGDERRAREVIRDILSKARLDWLFGDFSIRLRSGKSRVINSMLGAHRQEESG